MSNNEELQVSEWLRVGIAAAKAGRRAEAQELLMRVIETHKDNAQAWLWLSEVVDTDEDRLICLENVLTLDPDSARARAGLRWLQERGIGVESHAVEIWKEELGEEQRKAEIVDTATSQTPGSQAKSAAGQEPDLPLTPDGCVYCALPVSDSASRCSHCGGRLSTKQFTREERSAPAYMLHAFWILLSGITLAEFFLIGYIWGKVDNVWDFIRPYLAYLAGPAVTGDTRIETFIGPETLVQFVRYTNAGLAFLGGLVAVGLFLRVSRAHALGLVLIALQLVLTISLFILGFLGYLTGAIRTLFIILLTSLMFQTIDDFSKKEHRERLEPDRHLLNDADYYTRGRVYERRGMWAKALLHWQRAVAMNPDRDTYHAAVARAYAQLGRYEKALTHIDKALRLSRTPEEWQPLREIIVRAQHGAAVDQRL